MRLTDRQTGGSRLLLIEDNPHIIDEMRRHFSGRMFECEVALNVETARNVLSERQMDVVVMDQNMECVREVIPDILFEFKELDDNMKIIVFNGVADKSLQRKMRRMGADGYLSTKSDLEAVVRSTHRVLGLE